MNLTAKTLIQTGGQGGTWTRDYHLSVPTSGGAGKPLLVFLHGHGQTGTWMASVPNLDPWANKYVMAFPQGLTFPPPDNDPGWVTVNQSGPDGSPWPNPYFDEEFILQMIDAIAAEYGVDTSKVYLAGFSNGSGLTLQMACRQSALFKGFALYSPSVAFNGNALLDAPTTPRPIAISIGKQEDNWLGDAEHMSAIAGKDWICSKWGISNVASPPAGVLNNPIAGGTKYTQFDYGPTAKHVTMLVFDQVTVPALHRVFNKGAQDDINVNAASIVFWQTYAGLPA